jgi:hypothetical protein
LLRCAAIATATVAAARESKDQIDEERYCEIEDEFMEALLDLSDLEKARPLALPMADTK